MAEPFCPALRELLLDCAGDVETTVHAEGTYVVMEGPAFSTQAESLMHRMWGGDLIGMTCMPEAKLAKEAEMAYALVALSTDYDCWRPVDPSADKQDLLAEIIGNLKQATGHAVALIEAAAKRLGALDGLPSPHHDALALAIWSNKAKVPTATVERLQPILGRYFSPQRRP